MPFQTSNFSKYNRDLNLDSATAHENYIYEGKSFTREMLLNDVNGKLLYTKAGVYKIAFVATEVANSGNDTRENIYWAALTNDNGIGVTILSDGSQAFRSFVDPDEKYWFSSG